MLWLLIAVLLPSVLSVPSRPHIITILADDLGWNDFGHRGSNQISTPNIDALGYNGVIFGNHYVQQSCTPSRAAFLTGNYPIRSGYQGVPIFPGEPRTMPHTLPTLPKALKSLGYRNVMIGKWHLGSARKVSLPHNYGFDEFHGWWNGFVSYFGHTSETVDFKNRKVGVDLHENLEPNTDESGNYITDYVTRKAVSTINQHPQDTPLYLNINHNAGHTGITIGANLSVLEVHDLAATNVKYAHIKDEARRMLAEITERMDESIGKVLEALSGRGMLNNSIVLFFSDNGAPTLGIYGNLGSNWPFRGGKMSMWQGAVLSPTVLYSPLLKNKGRIYKDLVHITDWLPTLLSAAGGNPGRVGTLDGIDQWQNILLDKQVNKRKELLVNIDHKTSQIAYVGYNGRYKIVKAAPSLYDYVGDDGRDGSYKLDDVSESIFSKAAAKLHPLEEDRYLELRKQATVKNCRRSEFVKNCESDWCLFDLHEDPCETTDVSKLHPKVVQYLKSKVRMYDRMAAPPLNVPWDTNCDPGRCKGYWFPWLDEDEPCNKQKYAQ